MLFCLESIIIPRYFVTSNWKLYLTSGSRLKYSSVALWLIASYDFAILIFCYFRSSIDCTWVIFTFSQMAVWQPGRDNFYCRSAVRQGFRQCLESDQNNYRYLPFAIFSKVKWLSDWVLPFQHFLLLYFSKSTMASRLAFAKTPSQIERNK